MKQRDQMLGSKPGQRGLELQRFVDRFADELFDDGLTPGAERSLAKATAEALDAGDADAVHFACVAVEDHDASIDKNLSDFAVFSRFEIMIAEDGHRGYAQRPELSDEDPRLVRQSVIR